MRASSPVRNSFLILFLISVTDFFLNPLAYDETMKTMVIAATAIAVIPILLALFLPNWYLGDTQNAVDNANLEGEVDSRN